MQIVNQSRQCILATQVQVAASFWRRLSGWMFQALVLPEQGLYIKSCRGIHTWGMRFPIRALYISRAGIVLKVQILHPGKTGPWLWHCRGVLELPLSNKPGGLCAPGDQLLQIHGNGW